MSQVCIVTGASRGLGRGIALVLAREEGCTVYATARNEDALKALAEEAADGVKGGSVKPCVLDQSDDSAVHTFGGAGKRQRGPCGPTGEQRVCRLTRHQATFWQTILGTPTFRI